MHVRGIGAGPADFATANQRRRITGAGFARLAEQLVLLAQRRVEPQPVRQARQQPVGRIDQHGSVAGEFNAPPAFGLFPPPLEDLAGIPVDGGFETIDVGSPAANIVTPGTDAFMFDAGATGRFSSQLKRKGIKARSSLPGGESAIPGNPFYLNLLDQWLVNKSHRLLFSTDDVLDEAYLVESFIPME